MTHQHAQAQAAQAATIAQNHYNRLASNSVSTGNNTSMSMSTPDSAIVGGHSGSSSANPANAMEGGQWSEENRKVLGWVADLLNGNARETALMELSKKREQVPELALIVWHSFGATTTFGDGPKTHDAETNYFLGVMASLIQEIISVYPLLHPSQLTAAASNRVCNALALLQCVASHNDTRGLFLAGKFSSKP